MYSRPLTSQIFDPRPRLTTNARFSGNRAPPSMPPGSHRLAWSSNAVSSFDRPVVAGVTVAAGASRAAWLSGTIEGLDTLGWGGPVSQTQSRTRVDEIASGIYRISTP